MTGNIIHKEKDVTLVHKVSIDDCIADEIEKLNNIDDIFTLSSCCGHGEIGYIIVAGSDMQRMIDLGYNTIASKYLDNDTEIEGDRIVMMAFKSKSECKCIEKIER